MMASEFERSPDSSLASYVRCIRRRCESHEIHEAGSTGQRRPTAQVSLDEVNNTRWCSVAKAFDSAMLHSLADPGK